jgi:hypothetical protein
MPNFMNLPPFTENGDVHVVVETPRGSRAKFAYDPKLETFILSKSLLTGLTYPHDWGFVPSTKADDGDPLDIMVIHDAATFPGIVLTCRIIGILQIEQKSKGKAERNDRLFANLSSPSINRTLLHELGGSRFGVSSMERPCRPPDMSNFCCLPGRAGGTPIGV